VARGFLDEVKQHPAEGERLAVDPGGDRELVEAAGRGGGLPGAVARIAVAAPQPVRFLRQRRAELVVRVGLPVDALPLLPPGQAEEVDLEPGLLVERQVVEDARQGEIRGRDPLPQLLPGQALGLEQDRLPLVVEILPQCLPLARRLLIGVLPTALNFPDLRLF
jgi:hypothetical protein